MTREVCEHFNPVDQPCAKCEEKRKSEALFLADELEIPLGTVIQSEVCHRAAKELRRLHAELERCKQVCAATSESWRIDAEKWKGQRDALLEALILIASDACADMPAMMQNIARAAIKAAEENT